MPAADFTHLDAEGRARMVDVSEKAATRRFARAEAILRVSGETRAALAEGRLAKGDAFAVARLAGIAGAKRTADLVPLCHPLRLDRVEVEVELDGPEQVRIEARALAFDRTGVEMEALSAAAVAALALYDMVKGADRGAEVLGLRLLEKAGGRSGHWLREGVSPEYEPTGDS